MNRLIQYVDAKTQISYDGTGFDSLPSEDSESDTEDEEVHYHVDFLITNHGHAYFASETTPTTFVDDPLLYEIEVAVFEDYVYIEIPYFYSVEWYEHVIHNILTSLESESALQIYDEEESFDYQFKLKYNSPHPLLSSSDILRLFEGSLYTFIEKTFESEKLDEIGIQDSEEMTVYSLQGPDHIAGVYYIPDGDKFLFTTEYSDNPHELFDEMVFNLLHYNAPVDQLENPYEDIIDTQLLVPWLYQHGSAAVAFWDAIKDQLWLSQGETLYRDDVYNKTQEYAEWVSTLHARRMELDLLATLEYEYPLTEHNASSVLEMFDEIVMETPSELIWWNGQEQKEYEDQYLHRGAPHTTFSYPIEVGSKDDIVYFESDEMPIKIAVRLESYEPIVPLDGSMDFELSRDLSPFAWYGKPLGATKLDSSLSDDTIKSHLHDMRVTLQDHHFESGTQLLERELGDTLDVRVDATDDSTWESTS